MAVGSGLRQRLFAAPSAASEGTPFDPSLFARLDRLRLRVGSAHGARAGETPVRGMTQESGLEVESFKSYAPGDDIRHVDWNAAARIDQLLTRRFVAEREIPVHLLIDVSRSMAVPAEDRKLGFALRLAAALAYVALNNNDPVRIALLREGADGPQVEESPLLRHRGRFLRLRPFLSDVTASGFTALSGGVERYLERHRERGVAIVVSDFLVPAEVYERSLTRLRTRGLTVRAIQVIGRRERTVTHLAGRLRVVDAESGGVREVLLSEADRRRYTSAFDARTDTLRGFCHGGGIGHAVACPEDGVEHCLTRVLPSSGMIRLR